MNDTECRIHDILMEFFSHKSKVVVRYVHWLGKEKFIDPLKINRLSAGVAKW
jgi:hypothetical protein